jgi:calcineurin-like phosphoesterase family protein
VTMTWFSSDSHFWHQNVIRYCSRPYATVEDMNEDMVRRWNVLVKPEDTVYVLGDFSLAFRAVETFTHRLSGTKYLCPGNHDFCHSYHKKSRNAANNDIWLQKYRDHGWIVLPEQTTLTLEGLGTVNVCHHPYSDGTGNDTEHGYGDKYAKWRPADDGKILLCGHIHEKWKTKKSPKGTLMINVGVDVHDFQPVSLDQLVAIAEQEK